MFAVLVHPDVYKYCVKKMNSVNSDVWIYVSFKLLVV